MGGVFPVFGVEVRQLGVHQSGVIIVENPLESLVDFPGDQDVFCFGHGIDEDRLVGPQFLPLPFSEFDHGVSPWRHLTHSQCLRTSAPPPCPRHEPTGLACRLHRRRTGTSCKIATTRKHPLPSRARRCPSLSKIITRPTAKPWPW